MTLRFKWFSQTEVHPLQEMQRKFTIKNSYREKITQSPNTPRFHSLVYCCTTHQEEKTSLSFTFYRTPRRINFPSLLLYFSFALRFFGFPHLLWLAVCFLYRQQSLIKKQALLLLQVSSMSLSSCRSKLLLQVKPCAPSDAINFSNKYLHQLIIEERPTPKNKVKLNMSI